MFTSEYQNLTELQKMQLADVATNSIFRDMVTGLIAEHKQNMLNLSPGANETQFMLDYAMEQKELNVLEDLDKFLHELAEDLNQGTEET